MDDNRFAMMCVNRSGPTSRNAHGNEAVQTRSQAIGSTASAWDAPARTWRGASGRSAQLRGHAADGFDLGTHAGRESAGLAAAVAGTTRIHGCGGAPEAQ